MTKKQWKVRLICQLFWSLFGIGLGIYGFVKNDIRVLIVGCFMAQSTNTDANVDGIKRQLGKIGL